MLIMPVLNVHCRIPVTAWQYLYGFWYSLLRLAASSQQSIHGDLVHGADETQKNVEAFAEHVFLLWGSSERIVHMSH